MTAPAVILPVVTDSLGPAQRPELLTPGEVARLFRVDPKTVTRWAKAGRLPYIRTPGGHRRFRREDVDQLLRTYEQETP